MIWIPIQFTIYLSSLHEMVETNFRDFQPISFLFKMLHSIFLELTKKQVLLPLESSQMFQNIFRAFQNILNCSMIFQVVFCRCRILQNALETSNNNRELCIDSQQKTSVSSAIHIGDKGQGHIIITANLSRGSNHKNSSNLQLLKCLFVDHLQRRIGINFYSLLRLRLHLFRLLVDTKIHVGKLLNYNNYPLVLPGSLFCPSHTNDFGI